MEALFDFQVLSAFLLNTMPRTSSSKNVQSHLCLLENAWWFCPWQKISPVWVSCVFFFFFLFVCLLSLLNFEYTFPRVKEFSCLWLGGGVSYDLHGSLLWSRTGMQPLIHFQDKVSTLYCHTLDKLVFISWFIWPLIKGCLYFIQAVLFCLNMVDKKDVRLAKVN